MVRILTHTHTQSNYSLDNYNKHTVTLDFDIEVSTDLLS